MNVYFISGLAADRTVFKHLQLPSFCTPVYLDWLEPATDETLSQYALRLATAIDTAAPFALIGLSFGGMLATEIANKIKPVCTILISSIPTIQHLPGYFHVAGRLRLHKLIPTAFIQNAALLKRLFTTETGEDKIILKTMIRKSNPQLIRWALNAILTWQNSDVPENLIHVHGTRDKILPLRFVKPTHIISGGGHLMTLNRAREINSILSEIFRTVVERD